MTPRLPVVVSAASVTGRADEIRAAASARWAGADLAAVQLYLSCRDPATDSAAAGADLAAVAEWIVAEWDARHTFADLATLAAVGLRPCNLGGGVPESAQGGPLGGLPGLPSAPSLPDLSEIPGLEQLARAIEAAAPRVKAAGVAVGAGLGVFGLARGIGAIVNLYRGSKPQGKKP